MKSGIQQGRVFELKLLTGQEFLDGFSEIDISRKWKHKQWKISFSGGATVFLSHPYDIKFL